jgi:hypothetical protein
VETANARHDERTETWALILVILAAIIKFLRINHATTTTDISWDSYDVDIWAAVELNTGMFCVAAPAVKPLLG